jgi:hypothetical protein
LAAGAGYRGVRIGIGSGPLQGRGHAVAILEIVPRFAEFVHNLAVLRRLKSDLALQPLIELDEYHHVVRSTSRSMQRSTVKVISEFGAGRIDF